MPRDSTKVVEQNSAKKHHSGGEHCKRGHHETICLDSRSMSGHCYTKDKCIKLPDHQGCEWKRTYSQKSVHVEQEPVKLVIKEGCRKKKPDTINVDLKFKDGCVEKDKINVHVKKPRVHVQPQKVFVEVIESKDKCEKPKINVCVEKPKIHVKEPEVCVLIDKGCDVKAPEPIICVKRKKCPKGQTK